MIKEKDSLFINTPLSNSDIRSSLNMGDQKRVIIKKCGSNEDLNDQPGKYDRGHRKL